MSKPLVFISHVHEESAIALWLQQQLDKSFLGGIDFFVSSDRRSIRGGDRWLETIREALGRSCVVLSIISKRAIERPWINFEAGAAWLTKPIVPVCHSGIKPAQLPQPLQSLFGYNLHDVEDLKDLWRLIGSAAGLTLPQLDWESLSSELLHVILKQASFDPQPYGTSPAWVFPMSEDVRTIESLSASLSATKELRVYSIGLNLFWNALGLDIFRKRILNKGLKAKICMANFESEPIHQRMAEEPEHPIGIPGSKHLIRCLIRLEHRVGDKTRFEIRLFSHYPTYAMLAFDEELYVYPYGYRTLGNFSPTFYWKSNDAAQQFFREQFKSIWLQSKNASEVYTQGHENPRTPSRSIRRRKPR